MDLKALQDYHNWIGQSPEEILYSVKAVGGWAYVFPRSLPPWASKVRNYFNVTPQVLKRLDERAARGHLGRVDKRLEVLGRARILKTVAGRSSPENPHAPDPGIFDNIGERFALSDDVYKDEFGNIWFQMSPGGTIYHWGSDPRVSWAESAWQASQEYIPVFKLVSPDDTGGSRECCIKNPMVVPTKLAGVMVKRGEVNIGSVHNFVPVFDRIEEKPKYQGSYNYSETVVTGLAAHEMRDVKPHSGGKDFYVDPQLRFSLLAQRRFPEKDLHGKLLADQWGKTLRPIRH